MKNQHDHFENELKDRLVNFSEEPDDNMWSKVSSGITSVTPGTNWWAWSSAGVAAVVVVASLIYFSFHVNSAKTITSAAPSADPHAENVLSPADATGNKVVDEKQNTVLSPEALNDNHPALPENAVADVNEGNTSPVRARQQRERQKHSPAALTRAKNKTAGPTTDGAGLATVTHSAGGRVVNSFDQEQLSHIDAAAQDQKQAVTPGSSHPTDQQLLDGVRATVKDVSTDSIQNNDAAQHESGPSLTGAQESTIGLRNAETVATAHDDPTPLLQALAPNTEHGNDSADRVAMINHHDEQRQPPKRPVESSGKRPSDRIALYFVAMPTLGYQRIEPNQHDNVVVESFSKISRFSTRRLGLRAELGAEYAVSPRLKVFGGILYYQRKQTIDYTERVSSGGVVTASDSVITIKPTVTSVVRTFDYELKNVGVQFGVNYVLRQQKFLHVAGTGIEFHRALNKLSDEQKQSGFSSNPSTFVFYNVYYRVQYPADGKLRGIFQPTFNYSLYLNKDANAPFYVKPYGLGLNIGLTYNF